ncbi:LOW QUALITY PROTEIN: sugar transporter SWEET1 [Leguminivora glycinivorella]|uniref:LOW QUALITY PROTEIN: sugar transporter SWEET1 n=1 Tax=Leguminivora glycinivorella TaxID=1035111 RepID=UPI0020105034|nr:LOW QUALITY PROTEIN: sugar transporter SWEET1 [Leguminivora glycinivorella]
MEALSNALQPYKEIVGTVAAIVTMGQMFSGVFMCWDIYKQKDTKSVPLMAFSGGLVMGVLNLQYGFILRDDTMIRVNFFGIALSIVYLSVYFCYTKKKVQAWFHMGVWGAFTAAVISYVQMADPAVVENHLGTLLTAFMFYLIASPLFGLKEIIAKQSTEGLPFPMIISGTVVTFMWLLYGIILKNGFLVLQNSVAFVLCSAQLSLFVIYPSKPKQATKAKAKKAD